MAELERVAAGQDVELVHRLKRRSVLDGRDGGGEERTRAASGLAREVPGRALAASGRTLEVSGRALEVSGRTLEVPGWALEVSGRTLAVPGWALEVSGWALEVSGRTLAVPGWALAVPGWALEVSGTRWSHLQVRTDEVDRGDVRRFELRDDRRDLVELLHELVGELLLKVRVGVTSGMVP
jgi:hypothetical protein